MVLQEYKSFRNVHITLLPPELSKGEFLEQLCNWESSDSYQVPWGFCWPELPFSSPNFFPSNCTYSWRNSRFAIFFPLFVKVLSTAVHQPQRGCFQEKKKPEQFCNKPSKQICSRGSKAANPVPLLFLCSPPMDMLLYPKCCIKVLVRPSVLTHLLLLPIAAMALFTQQCISKRRFLLLSPKMRALGVSV